MLMEKAMIFETHAHYDDESYQEDRDTLLAAMPQQGICRVVNVGAAFAGCVDSIGLAEKYEHVYAAIGIHPGNIEDWNENVCSWLKKHAAWKKTVAIGEIGLDYHWEKEETVRQRQQEVFEAQLVLAREVGLPVIIHSREAAEDTLRLMKEQHAEQIGGVVHCYSYSKELAEEFVKMGFYIGVGGVITFKNARKLKDTVAALGLSHIVLETDCPYMAPEPYRGSRNVSTNISYVAAAIAELLGCSVQQVEQETMENAFRLFPRAMKST